MAERPCQQANHWLESRAWSDGATLAMNGENLAQQLAVCHGRVILGKCVTASDPLRVALLDQTMDHEPGVSRDQHDVAGNEIFAEFAFDSENIAWPD